jgi:hypothetical protein
VPQDSEAPNTRKANHKPALPHEQKRQEEQEETERAPAEVVDEQIQHVVRQLCNEENGSVKGRT